MNTSTNTRLLFRWGVNIGYSEWRPDQPHEDWSGHLEITGGELLNSQQVIYHGMAAPQHRICVDLPQPLWTSPHLEIARSTFGYKGCEGLLVDAHGDSNSRIRFQSKMLDVSFNLGDIPDGDWLSWPAGPKYSCSELTVCRLEDDGIYWNKRRADEAAEVDGIKRLFLGTGRFHGNFQLRELHHQESAWIPPGETVSIPFRWESDLPAIVTWRFTANTWAPRCDGLGFDRASIVNSSFIPIATGLDGHELSQPKYRAKYFRGAYAALEHVDELGRINADDEHTLSIANRSSEGVFLILKSVMIQDLPHNWEVVKDCLPFKAEWFKGELPEKDTSQDLPSSGRGVFVGVDTNMMAAENGWIDVAVRYLDVAGAGNFIIIRTETDLMRAEDWRRIFHLCHDKRVYFIVNSNIPGSEIPAPEVLELAKNIGGEYFLGVKQHELSLPMYAGWDKYPESWGSFSPNGSTSPVTLDLAENAYLAYVRNAYSAGTEGVKRVLGEAMLAHRYAYKAGVDCILSETMTGNTVLLLAEGRGAARAYRQPFWGVHIACHVHCTPETWRHERMFWLNLYLSYLAGASIIEDEEGALAKVHSFVSGPSDPLPTLRQANMGEFFRWTRVHPRTAPLEVEIGLIYGRHEVLTGGMSLNTKRPVRVWEAFGSTEPEWEYGRPERGWLLADIFLPGVWLCPILQEQERLRRWFAGTPYGQVDVIPIEADSKCLTDYKLLVFPGWNTMTDDDLERLTCYVEGGGTLVMGLPQLQTSVDRTAVLSGGKLSFPDSKQLEHFCGFRITDRFSTVTSAEIMGKSWDFSHPEDGPLRISDIEISSPDIRVILKAADAPLLVEHRLGAGRVFLFTALEHFGHRGLLPLVREWLEQMLKDFPFSLRLTGGDGEVSFFSYPEEGDRRCVYLINTDWTSPGNRKICTIGNGDSASVQTTVYEGEVAKILI